MSRLYSFEKLPDATKAESVKALQKLLYCGLDLNMQIKESHWTLVGREFLSVHRLLDEVSEGIEDTTDDYAERISQLGHKPRGTVQIVADKTPLPPYPELMPSIDAHVELIARRLADFSGIANEVIESTNEIGDAITCDLVTSRTRDVNKLIWLVESHLPDNS